MPANFLDLHIVDFCQLSCRHCYLNKGNRFMLIRLIKSICNDFLDTKFPPLKREIILSGGEPLLHPNFAEICEFVRKLVGSVRLSSNGILIPRYIHTFKRHDGIQISVDGNKEVHDFIRGEGSYEKAINALYLLDEYEINHGIGFTLNRLNLKCVDHVIDLCIETGSRMLNLNIFHPINNSPNNSLEAVTFKEWVGVRDYAIKRAEKEGISIPTLCIEKGCIAGGFGIIRFTGRNLLGLFSQSNGYR